MLPMRLFGSRAFSSANATSFFLYASLFGAVFFMAQFLQAGLGYGPLGTGVRLLPWTATVFAVAPVAGALADRIGERPFMAAGLLLQTVGMAWIGLIAAPSLAYPQLVAPLVIAGCGVSMALPAAQRSAVGAVAPSEIGKASGTFTMLRQLGGVFGVAVLVAVFAGAGGYASPRAFTDGFAPAIGVAAALSLAGMVAALATPGRRPATEAAPAPAQAVPVLQGEGGP
jgi:MFS family permease